MTNTENLIIPIEDQRSLVHLGSLDSFDITEGGIECAKLILSFLENGDNKLLEKAITIYEELIPNENFGGEYTALEWLCRTLLTPKDTRSKWEETPFVSSFWHMMSDNDFDNLKTYLNYKYHIIEYDDNKDNTEMKSRMRFLEDFILFNNPDRERWESTRENMERFDIKKGMKVADVGCGSGYFTFKFADIVGEEGYVYATETNPRHLEFLHDYVERYNINNVEVVESSFEGIGLDPKINVDVVYICSLYHNVYAAYTDAERNRFVHSIRNALKPHGKLIIVDNDLVHGSDLPYHGPYINKKLIISQLWYYGFKLINTFQFTPQRYVLIFEMKDIPKSLPFINTDGDPSKIFVDSAASLVRYRIIGTSTSGYTKRGKIWGRLMYEGITENNKDKLIKAYIGFSKLWPIERIGDDYTAFLWFISVMLSDNKEVSSEDKLTDMYLKFFSENNWERMKKYLYYKFDLEIPNDPNCQNDSNFEYRGKDFPIPTLNIWNEYLIFNNPNRYLWEHTYEMLEFCNIKKGDNVADIGCGPGFFTWEFSKAVGSEGKVYATEISKNSLSFLENFVEKYNIKNIETVVAKMNDACLEENSVDVVFMCSMYHAVYITDIEFVKDEFVASIHKALRKGGRLIIVDNNVTPEGVPSYYGPGIKPELIIAQLGKYGFRLVSRWSAIMQRFVLIFEQEEGYVAPEPRKEIGNERKQEKSLRNLRRQDGRGADDTWDPMRDERPDDDMRERNTERD